MKKFLDKILDMPKLIKTIWIMLWIILVILLIFKFCFGMWYPIVVDNESFMNVCNFVDENKWLYNLLLYIFYMFNFYIGYLTCRGMKKFPKWYMIIIALIVALGISLLKQFNNAIGLIVEIIFIVIVPIILNIKKYRFKNNIINILIPLGFYALLNLWQFTMLVVRNVDGLIISQLPFLIYLILQFDYYIFTIITWIGVSFMGFGGLGWFWSKDVTVLRAEKEKELAKKEPDMDKIAKIDSRIAELEKEGK